MDAHAITPLIGENAPMKGAGDLVVTWIQALEGSGDAFAKLPLVVQATVAAIGTIGLMTALLFAIAGLLKAGKSVFKNFKELDTEARGMAPLIKRYSRGIGQFCRFTTNAILSSAQQAWAFLLLILGIFRGWPIIVLPPTPPTPPTPPKKTAYRKPKARALAEAVSRKPRLEVIKGGKDKIEDILISFANVFCELLGARRRKAEFERALDERTALVIANISAELQALEISHSRLLILPEYFADRKITRKVISVSARENELCRAHYEHQTSRCDGQRQPQRRDGRNLIYDFLPVEEAVTGSISRLAGLLFNHRRHGQLCLQ